MRRFNDPDDRNRQPEDLTAWLAAGMRRVDAQAWRDGTSRWRTPNSGERPASTEALTAAQWTIAGVNPTTVHDWLDANISVAEAIRWHEFGFKLEQAREHAKKGRSPDEAYGLRDKSGQASSIVQAQAAIGRTSSSIGGRIQVFLKAGVSHQVMASYLHTQWTDDEAVAWSKEGIQAWDAKIWQSIGITPTEAGELHKAKKTPAEIIQEWWRSGIPYDEVANWLGAGLTPDEAVAQRESGVTVEQAAALRALRRGGAL